MNAAALAPPARRPPSATPPPASPPVSVEQFHALLDAGAFPNDGAQTELIDGEIREKPVPEPLHSGTVRRVWKAIEPLLPNGWEVRLQDSVTFLTSEPLPDLTVVPEDEQEWFTRHPSAADCAVLIEVSDSTLALDRGRKLRMYAAAGVSPYWIVNLIARQIEVYDRPTPGGGTDADPPGYRRRDVSPGETLTFACGGVTVTLDAADLLPPAGGAGAGSVPDA